LILPTVTWGQLRATYREYLDSPEGTFIEDNLLANPLTMQQSEGKADGDYVFPEEAKKFLEYFRDDDQTETLQEVLSDQLNLWFALDDDGSVLELVKYQDDPDGTFIRSEGKWVDISYQDYPRLDEVTAIEATNESVAAWDFWSKKGQNLTLSDIEPYSVRSASAQLPRSALYFTVDCDDSVLELVKEEEESPGAVFVRNESEWVDISGEPEFPTVEDQKMMSAKKEVVTAWDLELEKNEDRKVSDIRPYLAE
jgi:hypothetical protein